MNTLSTSVVFGVILFANVSITLYAQTTEIKPAVVIPPSPDAAALGKYGSIPVGLHTGTPNIDIPLYTVKSGSLELPISLSYHASGVKVNETASWVGLGWTLNAGGAISRSIIGKSDEVGFWSASTKNSQQITSSDFTYLKLIADGTEDGESDLYFYNFGGRSGKFVYAQNNPSSPLLIPREPIQVTYTSGVFKITSENGTVYTFGQGETTTLPNETFDPTTSYYLTKITSADGSDEINLTYVQDGGYPDLSTVYTETIGERYSQVGTGGVSYVPNEHLTNYSTTGRTIHAVRLNEITFKNGKIKFVRDLTRSDLTTSRLGEIQVFAKNFDGSYESTPSRRFTLGEGYFNSGVNSRLKLNHVEEKDQNSQLVHKHQFFYNESVALPPKGSNAQDWWGFYNGQTGNTTLIATETINFQGNVYNVGGANRSPNSSYMQAGILQKIVYPTGGYTEFVYEPHSYTGITKTPTSINASSGQVGNTTDLLQQTKTFTPNTSGWARVRAYTSDVTDTEPFFSTITLRKANDQTFLVNHIYSPYQFNPYPAHIEKDYWVYLWKGVTYELKAMSKGHSNSTQFSGAAFASGTVYWDEETQGAVVMAGGLRVKEIRDYADASGAPIKKIYKYGNGNGAGVLISPQYGLSSSKQEIDFVFNVSSGQSMCSYGIHSGSRMQISSRPPFDLTALNGAPVVYSQVTVLEESESAPNGKGVFFFDAQQDEFSLAHKAYNNGVYQLNNSWRGGDEVLRTTYRGTSDLVEQHSSVYSVLQNYEVMGTKVGYKISMEGCPPSAGVSQSILFSHLYYFDYPFFSGVKKLIEARSIVHSSTDPTKSIENRTTYSYNNLSDNHQQLSRKVVLESDGNTLETHYWYPADYGSVGNIQTLLTKNIINTPVKEEGHRNNQIITGRVNRLNADGKPYEIYAYESTSPQTPPAHNPNAIIPSGYVKKIDITYDGTTKNIKKVTPVANTSSAYLWAYNNSYPVAKIENADPANVAATSFESDGKGNWIYSGATYDDIAVKTGRRYYKLSGGNITRTLTAGKYRLEYWSKGTVTVSGGTVTTIYTSPPDANGWLLSVKEINATSNVTLTVSGVTSIDEIRLYPVDARITTYTFDTLNGITSINDPNNAITYYDYDSDGRLQWIRDRDGNIMKAIDYHYKEN